MYKRKWTLILLAVWMLMCITACGQTEAAEQTPPPVTAIPTVQPTAAPTDPYLGQWVTVAYEFEGTVYTAEEMDHEITICFRQTEAGSMAADYRKAYVQPSQRSGVDVKALPLIEKNMDADYQSYLSFYGCEAEYVQLDIGGVPIDDGQTVGEEYSLGMGADGRLYLHCRFETNGEPPVIGIGYILERK